MSQMNREKGAESGTMPCPNGCGTELELVAEEDGKVATTVCPSCYGGTAAEKEPEQKSNPGNQPNGGNAGNQGGVPPEEPKEGDE